MTSASAPALTSASHISNGNPHVLGTARYPLSTGFFAPFTLRHLRRCFAIQRSSGCAYAVLASVIAVNIALRYYFYHFQSWDLLVFLTNWYNYIHIHHGIYAFGHMFANYNVPYLYILMLGSYLNIGPLATVKIAGAVFDFVLASYGFAIARHLGCGIWRQVGAFSCILLLPTVFANSSLWGQSDGVYTCFLFAGVYYLLCNRGMLSAVSFGVAISIKLQAVFIIPAILIWVIKKRFPVRGLFVMPIVYAVFLIPVACVADNFRSFWEFCTVYLQQSAGNHALNIDSASVWALFPFTTNTIVWVFSLIVLGVTLAVFEYVSCCKITVLTDQLIIVTAALSVFLVPFFAPSMHERYAFAADCFLMLTAWVVSIRFFLPALLTESASLCTYLPLIRYDITTIFPGVYHSLVYQRAQQIALDPHAANLPIGNRYYFYPLGGYWFVSVLNIISWILLAILYAQLLAKNSSDLDSLCLQENNP